MWALRYLSAVIVVSTLVSLPIVNGGDCGDEFLNKCSCGFGEYVGRKQYIVNCTNTGFRDANMLQSLPRQTEVLIWTGNYVPELPWNVFGTLNDFDNLSVIDMSNNHIREIRGKSYHHVANVKRLILNHNNLSISRDDDDDVNHHHPRVFSNFVNLMELHLTNAFSDNTSAQLSEDLHDIFVNSNLTRLTKLHLEQNEIRRFKDRQVFCDLPSLRDLHLGDNLLEEINFNVLCLKHLRFLDLERNKFTQMRLKDLNVLDLLASSPAHDAELIVDLTFNQLACDCTINNIQDWLRKTRVKIRNLDNLFCYKEGRPSQPLLSYKHNKCRVQSRTGADVSEAHTVTVVFLSVVLVTIVLSLVATAIYINRSRIRKIVNPVMTNVSRKVHYTTIKDDDAPEQYV